MTKRIITTKAHDFQIGHAYFMESAEDRYDLISRMNKKVIPLLLEYFMDDNKEVKSILTEAGLEVDAEAWPIKIKGKRS